MEKPGFLSRLLFGDPQRSIALELYGGVVAAARTPNLYSAGRVPDTPEGRYEMVVLHLVLLNRRLEREGPAGLALARLVNEAFVEDMDDCMRELGIGDLTVPKKVKRAAAGLFERGALYGTALAGEDRDLEAALASAMPGIDGGALARHVRGFDGALARLAYSDLARGALQPEAGDAP